VIDRPTADQLLATPGALLTRTHLRELGLGRAAVDAVFRQLDVVVFPGSTRPHIKRDDYLELVARSTYADDRVRPT
jgi:fructose-1-phosphate kinase PfkB-like protein